MKRDLTTARLRVRSTQFQKADTLIIAGTSLTVYPAAGFIRYFGGDNLVLINRDPTPMDKNANLVFHEKRAKLLESQNYRKHIKFMRRENFCYFSVTAYR